MEISKRDEKKIQRFRSKLHSRGFETHRRAELVFHRCEYKISCINFRIFESISRKSENYDSSVPFFFVGSAELWPRKNCSRRNADRCAFPSAVRDLISYRFCAIYSRRQRYSNRIIKITFYIYTYKALLENNESLYARFKFFASLRSIQTPFHNRFK